MGPPRLNSEDLGKLCETDKNWCAFVLRRQGDLGHCLSSTKHQACLLQDHKPNADWLGRQLRPKVAGTHPEKELGAQGFDACTSLLTSI
jgi:hypothetical protein